MIDSVLFSHPESRSISAISGEKNKYLHFPKLESQSATLFILSLKFIPGSGITAPTFALTSSLARTAAIFSFAIKVPISLTVFIASITIHLFSPVYLRSLLK